ncbi:RNA ligase-domain-containing protein [Protomyces lactucae-debilis]|uniref:RNA ligase-domain-containing protein n=1 Tax=Protomyces lactucae-debilis TaxID=2754530 RepID=A0A1Y2ERB9_PROLT|nr:RNA ligase-domain-containing protein [Protomyces lactucae-debilis]ORY74143.1 RNA ligase-domain-containing protein [Protomyces lactucae-debilis]
MTFKVLLLGDSGVGKTSLRTQYLHKTFSLSYRATIGANFITKQVPVSPHPATGSMDVCASGEMVSLCLWDTAGQERFNALGPSFFRGADAALLLYDCTVPDSIQRLKHHLASFLKHSGTANPVVVLVGNKCDCGCLVSPEEALIALEQSHALDGDAEWYTMREDVDVREVSARTGMGVDALFREVAQRCRDREARRDLLAFEVEDDADLHRRSIVALKRPIAATRLHTRTRHSAHVQSTMTLAPSTIWRIGAGYGFAAVGLGAFGAHGLQQRAGIDAKSLKNWETASSYLLQASFHCAADCIGAFMFSGSIYGLVLGSPSLRKVLGPVTPLGVPNVTASFPAMHHLTSSTLPLQSSHAPSMEVVPGVRSLLPPPDAALEADTLIRHLTTLYTDKIKLNGDKRPTIKCTDLRVPGTQYVLQSWKMDEFSYGKPDKPLPTDARGLFTMKEGDRYQIIARGYDKFFNTDEVAATKWQALEQTTSGPYDLTLKSNGCIIFLAALPNGELLVTSKHSLGARSDTAESHAQRGEYWIKRHLEKVGKTTKELAHVLQKHNITAVAELCDDAFEEHILAYPPEKSGLYLHGLNINTPRFATYSAADVATFAEYFGMFKTDFITKPDLPSLRALLEKCSKSGTYLGTEVEGFVIRTRRPDGDFFFKYKFEEPYLLFRQWREVTKQIISGGEPVFKKHATITREYIQFILPLIRDASLAKQYQQNHGIIELRQRFLDHRGGDLTDIINNPELAPVEIDPRKDWFVLVPIATIGCGKTTLALALERLFGFGHIQNDNILAKKASFPFAEGVYIELSAKRIVVADRNNHMLHERKSLAHDLIGLRKVRDPPLHFVALSFEQSAGAREVMAQRVLARGDNHQSIRAATQGPEAILKIMNGFHQRFQPLDTSKPPDDVFWEVISLDPCLSVHENLQKVVTWLVDHQLVPNMPNRATMDDAVEYAMGYKPSVHKHVAVHESQTKQKKTPKVTYFGLAVLESSQVLNLQHPIIEQFKRNNWLQNTFHITLAHRASSQKHTDVWQYYTSRTWEDEEIIKVRSTHLVFNQEIAALAIASETVSLPFVNDHLHITLGTAPEVKPVAANALLERWHAGDDGVQAVEFEATFDVQLRRFY